jgi:hypothetical protein
MQRRWWTLAVLGLLAVGSTACGNPQPNTASCATTTTAVVSAIARRVTVEGELRNARQVTDQKGGVVFVSAELHLSKDKPDHRGKVLTWVSRPGDERFESVDEHARADSSWPGSTYDVRRTAALESRGCADLLRGFVGDDKCADVEGGLKQLCKLGTK